MQNGLHRALAAKGLAHVNKRNGAWGRRTTRDVCRFKSAYLGRATNCKVFGSDAWAALRQFLGRTDRALIRQHNRNVAAARAAAQAAREPRRKLAAVAMRCYAERWRYRY